MSEKRPYTLQEIAHVLKLELRGNSELEVTGCNDLESASTSEISFFANPRYEQAMKKSKACAVIVAKEQKWHAEVGSERNFLLAEDPSRAFQELIEFFSKAKKEASLSAFLGVHPTAVIHETVQLADSVTVGPHAVVDAHAKIGANTFIASGCYIGRDVTIGADCVIHPHVVIRESCVVGNRVVIQPGAIIGSCGFGFTTNKTGEHTKLSQLGIVIIEDDVEIGANTTIDRARFQATKISKGTKIDNLVQIGHAVVVGEHNIIISQTGIAGSTKTGRHVILAGKVAVNGHITIGDNVRVAACSGVSKSLTEPGEYGGVPVLPIGEYNRMAVHLRNIEKIVKEHRRLKQQVDELIRKG